MSTVTVRTVSTRAAAPTALERLLLDGAAALEGIAMRHMQRRQRSAAVERRRARDAETRRDAQAAGNLSLLPR
ncbi:hypothetical protein [Microbacterium rhizosphaerae]|jgi:hypothetical protein|uniref:Uncharacterized protein n=1 Tax=Microbacterium rhizosphaerae TaxID=1678237 RepID=A0ABZ0SVK5_9MICO|nr:hypothetical protein [Microbacterium rhizosphaerae]WPR91267.1 hypothetical protein SM116_08295 [Microbacterium rhizosphaerae]